MGQSIVVSGDDPGWGPGPIATVNHPPAGSIVVTGDDGFGPPAGVQTSPPSAGTPDPGIAARTAAELKLKNATSVNDLAFGDSYLPDGMAPDAQAMIRGAGQGLPFVGSHTDEITAGVRAGVDVIGGKLGLSPETDLAGAYRRRVADERAVNRKMADEHPESFYTGMGATTLLVPGPKSFGTGLADAAITSLGASDADLTKGEYGKAAEDTLLGAAPALVVGGALKGAEAGVSAIAKGAYKRIEGRMVNGLLEGTPARTIQDPALRKLGGREGLAATLGDEGLDKLAKGPASKLEEEVSQRLDDVGDKLGKYYKAVDKAAPSGIPVTEVQDAMRVVQKQAKAASDVSAFQAIQNQIDGLAELHGEDAMLSAEDVHGFAKTLGKKGFATNVMHPSEASKLSRALREQVVDVLQQHVDDVLTLEAAGGNMPNRSIEELRQLNDQYGKLRAIESVAAAKAERDQRFSPTLGQRMMQGIKAGSDIGAIGGAVASIASGNPSLAAGALAAGAAARLAPHAAAATDRASIRVANWLKDAGSTEAMLARASAAGIPRNIALQLVQMYGDQAPGEAAGPGGPAGMLAPGNIDLYGQPEYKNPDGSISTVRSFSTDMGDGKETLLSTITPDGRSLSQDEAIREYEKTGKHLGVFDTPENADAYAEWLHSEYAAGKYRHRPGQ